MNPKFALSTERLRTIHRFRGSQGFKLHLMLLQALSTFTNTLRISYVHRDVKTNDVLLDGGFRAKVTTTTCIFQSIKFTVAYQLSDHKTLEGSCVDQAQFEDTTNRN